MSTSTNSIPKAPAAQIVTPEAACSTCKITKKSTDYSSTQWSRRVSTKTKAGGGTGHCRDCIREKDMLRRYDLTKEQFEELLTKQKNICALPHCKKKIDKTNAHIDHDHHTKKVRGLLCMDCNCALGKMGDQVDKLLDVACYLAAATETLSPLMKIRTDHAMKTLVEWYEKHK